MKKLALSALAAIAVVGSSYASPAVVASAKDFKQPAAPQHFFQDKEIALDAFYSYNDASHQNPVLDPDRLVVLQPQYLNDGNGGGAGLNFFFMRYVGVGVEGNWWNGARDGRSFDAVVHEFNNGATLSELQHHTFEKDVVHQVTGNLILRYPMEFCSFGLAPYILGGGGGLFDGKGLGFGDVGAGVEVRLTPHIGVFTDWRWNFISGGNDVNTTRAGLRFVF